MVLFPLRADVRLLQPSHRVRRPGFRGRMIRYPFQSSRSECPALSVAHATKERSRPLTYKEPAMSGLSVLPVTEPAHPLTQHTRFQVYSERQLAKITQLARLSPEQRFEMQVVASVLPFRVNQYVIDELIDWDNVPNDPVFQLTFPQRGMLEPADYDLMAQALRDELPRAEITKLAREIQARLNPHPA